MTSISLKKYYAPVFALFLLFPLLVSARHIVGGVMSYRFKSRDANGNNTYEMTMKVYLDQYAVNTQPNTADLDVLAPIGVYRGSVFYHKQSVPLKGRTTIANPTFPCLTPPNNILVTEGLYIWEEILPDVGVSYTVEWQRCCRNKTISNIADPSNTGATFSIEITPAAQANGNSSPEFNTFPPTLICVSEPVNYDHSATDIDHDQITYEFCAPVTGGGPDLMSMTRGCGTSAPDPPCAPPFVPVIFNYPAYTASAPIHGLTIDPNTGIITGTPDIQGQFVVGVCAKEYRNGVLLSVLQRDFQFNVVLCKPTVAAIIKADTMLNGKKFLIQSCGQNNVYFDNQSVDRANISEFYWDFVIQGIHKRYTDWSPTISFPDTGIYHGQLLLNPGTKCADTADITLNVFNKPLANFTFNYDTCVAGPVVFTDKSSSPAGEIVQWKWDFSDGQGAAAKNPSHLYQTVGTKNVGLHIVDVKNCTADTIKSLVWAPAPATVIVQPSTYNGCSPATVAFKNLSKPIDSTYKTLWTFGDGGTSADLSPTHSYLQPGTYGVGVSIVTPLGCKVSAFFPDWINVKQGVKADFDFSPQVPTVFNSTVQFTDKSTFAKQWRWFFGAKGTSGDENPVFTFKDTGVYKILLIAGNEFGCQDSIVKYIDFLPRVTYFLPNAFSPNDDGNNDVFKGTGIFSGMKDFTMKIWNRWGEMIFESTDPNTGWNGKKYNTGADSPQGVYLFVVTYTGPRGAKAELKGFSTLVR